MRKQNKRRSEETLAETLAGASAQVLRRLWPVTKTGAWLMVQLSTVNWTGLGAQEWQDTLLLIYGLNPPDLLKFWNSCNSALSIFRDIDCNKGGLITAHHNEICDGVADLVCAKKPSYLQVAPCKFQSLSRPVPHSPH